MLVRENTSTRAIQVAGQQSFCSAACQPIHALTLLNTALPLLIFFLLSTSHPLHVLNERDAGSAAVLALSDLSPDTLHIELRTFIKALPQPLPLQTDRFVD